MSDFRCINFRTIWIQFKFSRPKVFVMVVYGPTEEKVEERERFWNDLDKVVDKVRNGYRLCVLEI